MSIKFPGPSFSSRAEDVFAVWYTYEYPVALPTPVVGAGAGVPPLPVETLDLGTYPVTPAALTL